MVQQLTSGMVAMLATVTMTAVYISTSIINEAKYQAARIRTRRGVRQATVYRSALKPEAMK